MYDGMINVRKEKGFTSHDVVAKLRGILHQKKIGHTGTLDPDAEGVLPVCLGKGTKLCSYMTDYDKCYHATMRLGLTSDTQDISGRILKTRPVTCTEQDVRQVLISFIGGYEQIPPMFSARKVGGKKLYELARAGREIERKPCHVDIYAIEDLRVCMPEISFTVRCSKGTYVRTLCHDAGEKLGCGAVLTSLLRVSVGPFKIDDAHTLSEIEERAASGDEALHRLILPVEDMLQEYPAACVFTPVGDKRLKNGNPLPCDQVRTQGGIKRGAVYKIYDFEGHFTALYACADDADVLRCRTMFL